MDLLRTKDGHLDIRGLMKMRTPLSEFRLGRGTFRLTGEDSDDDDQNLPVNRDDVWQGMLRAVLGYVPEGAEHAPPCYCELRPIAETYGFGGLAGLPPAVRLMDGFFPVRNQSKRGACFAFALVALCEYMLGKTVELSEQSLFHFTKLVTPGKVESLTDGAFTLDAIHAIEEYGICPLSEWHYNPESWNYVEDPFNEGQGMALQRKLVSAQKYRFRHWRMLSDGSVLQFKQALSAKFPVYTGVLVTTDWKDEAVRRTGVIPVPWLLWNIRVLPPPRGLVENIMEENGIDPDDDGAEMIAMQIAGKLIQDTISYIGSAVFGCELFIVGAEEGEDGVEVAVLLDKICGGHALCLAGYADDPSYPGGGYFIARNSWSDTEWAPESPEMPGYALIPYAYIADYGQEGVVMAEFPNESGSGVAACSSTPPLASHTPQYPPNEMHVASSFRGGPPFANRPMANVAGSSAAYAGTTAMRSTAIPHIPTFEEWLKARETTMTGAGRDSGGVLLRPGTPILLAYPPQKKIFYKDTAENRNALRSLFEEEVGKIQKEISEIRQEEAMRVAQAEHDRQRIQAEKEKANEKRLHDAVRAIVNGSLARLIPPDAEVIREGLLRQCPDLECPSEQWITDAMHELVAQFPDKYKLCPSFDGRFEEIQKV